MFSKLTHWQHKPASQGSKSCMILCRDNYFHFFSVKSSQPNEISESFCSLTKFRNALDSNPKGIRFASVEALGPVGSGPRQLPQSLSSLTATLPDGFPRWMITMKPWTRITGYETPSNAIIDPPNEYGRDCCQQYLMTLLIPRTAYDRFYHQPIITWSDIYWTAWPEVGNIDCIISWSQRILDSWSVSHFCQVLYISVARFYTISIKSSKIRWKIDYFILLKYANVWKSVWW